MYIYKFRIEIEENDEYLRVIEITANNSLEDFHSSIIESNGLDGNELSSFYICDSKWRKQKEFTLVDMGADEIETNEAIYEDEDYEDLNKAIKVPRMIMKNIELNECIDDPHQKLIYLYNYIKPQYFYIELIKTFETDNNSIYPKCVTNVGKLPETKKDNLIITQDSEPLDFEHFDDDNILDIEEEFLDENISFDIEEEI